MKHYTLSDLEDMETIGTCQADDLKIDSGTMRVWLSRCGIDDGMPYDNQVTVEVYNGDRWEIAEQYEAE